MIYLDSAATSLQKPRSVSAASINAMNTMASPGRGGHRPAMLAAETAFNCRNSLAKLFNVDEPENVVFTLNATHGLNIAINSLISSGDRVVISGYEHNAVTRPLHQIGANIDVANSPLFDQQATLDAFRKRIPGARAVICNHVSNVFGFILPVYEIAELCAEHKVPLVIDASQSGGVLEVDMQRLQAQFIAMPGHKGLLGPQGTGVLLCGGAAKPFMAGGTGSDSKNQSMPDFLPDMLEAGTHNITGIAGLQAGTQYVLKTGTSRIEAHERRLTALMTRELSKIQGVELFTAADPTVQAGVLSVRHSEVASEELASRLGAHGVAVRAGLHCAPLAHKNAGTLESGTVRYSFSPFNRQNEITRAAAQTAQVIKSNT